MIADAIMPRVNDVIVGVAELSMVKPVWITASLSGINRPY